MSEENVGTIGRVFEAVGREDWVAVEGFFAPDCEIHDFDIPDGEVYKGPAGFFDWVAQWDAAWESWTMDDVEIHPAADERVVALFTTIATGRASGVELKRRDAMIFTLQDDKIVRLEYHNEQQKGPPLKAAGLSE